MVARHGNIAAGDVDALVRAQCSGKHDKPTQPSSGGGKGLGPIEALSKGLDWLMR